VREVARLAAKDRDETKRKITNWLTDEGFAIQKQADPKAFFNYNVEMMEGLHANIGQAIEGASDKIQMATTVTISPQHLKLMKDMGPQERTRFLWDIKFTLAQRNVEFQMFGASGQPDGNNPANVTLVAAVWYDGLTKDRFMSVLYELKMAALIFIWSFKKREGAPILGFDPLAA
jgi:hypothetical protein